MMAARYDGASSATTRVIYGPPRWLVPGVEVSFHPGGTEISMVPQVYYLPPRILIPHPSVMW